MPAADHIEAPDSADAPACPICGDAQAKPRYRLREMLFGTREAFDYRHCQHCGVLWLERPPADMSSWYPESSARPSTSLVSQVSDHHG